jgi:hypothetical protein
MYTTPYPTSCTRLQRPQRPLEVVRPSDQRAPPNRPGRNPVLGTPNVRVLRDRDRLAIYDMQQGRSSLRLKHDRLDTLVLTCHTVPSPDETLRNPQLHQPARLAPPHLDESSPMSCMCMLYAGRCKSSFHLCTRHLCLKRETTVRFCCFSHRRAQAPSRFGRNSLGGSASESGACSCMPHNPVTYRLSSCAGNSLPLSSFRGVAEVEPGRQESQL